MTTLKRFVSFPVTLLVIVLVGFASTTTYSADDIESARKKCTELGFKPKTEGFGKCVLQLSRPEESRPAAVGISNTVRVSGSPLKDCTDCPEMVAIPAGSFLMGSKVDPFAESHSQPSPDEMPQHKVSIKAFSLGKFEVTQEQWFALMGNLPSNFKGRTLPVEQVSWDEAQAFVKKLSEKTGKKYRLPSEAEWEYAARAGSQTAYSFGDDARELGRYAWFGENSGMTTHAVGEKQPNAFGLYDMSGNVLEWTEDCWNDNYNGAPTDGRAWTAGNCSRRGLRGGSWFDPDGLRTGYRYWFPTASRNNSSGFRVAREN